jgi:KaiC/GvpD/RAD55 family RecA-like ATPase
MRPASEVKSPKIKTYVKGLDERIGGGIPQGHVVLICGASGSMKTSLAFNILYNTIKELGLKGIYVSLEQDKNSILNQITELGFDTNVEPVHSNLAIIDLGTLRAERGVAEFDTGENFMTALQDQLTKYKENLGFDLLVIDSLDALCTLARMQNPRDEIFRYMYSLRKLGLTTFLITEMERDSLKFGRYGVESFIADGIIHLDLRRVQDLVNMYIGVVKMRAVKHDRNYYPLLIDKGGFKIVAK